MAKWTTTHTLEIEQAGVYARISGSGGNVLATLCIGGCKTPSGSTGGNQEILVRRDFEHFDVNIAKAWIEGVLLGAVEMAKEGKSTGSIVGICDAWADLVADAMGGA